MAATEKQDLSKDLLNEEEKKDEPKDSCPEEVGTDESALTRVTNLPIVTTTLTKVSDVYNWTKESNSLVKYSLECAEKGVAAAASSAQPVVGYLEKPLTYANTVANQQLDKLEEKVPLITEPSNKVVTTLQDGAWNAVEKTKAAGTQQMNNLMNTSVGKVVTATVDAAMGLSERAIDYCLPEEEKANQEGKDIPAEDENVAPVDESQAVIEYNEDEPFTNSLQKASQLSTKVRRRLYQKALINIQFAQKRSQETVDKLRFTVDLIEYAKTNIDSANQGVRQRMNDTQDKLWTTWDKWTTEEKPESEISEGESSDSEDEEDVSDKIGEQKTLAIVRNLTRRLRVLSSNIGASVKVLPQNLGKRVEEARDTVEVFYNSFEEAQYFKDLPSSMLTTARDQLDKLSATSVAIADHLINSSAMKWLVPDGVRQYVHQISKSMVTENGYNHSSLLNNDEGDNMRSL